jgi:cytochrome P450
LDGHWDGGRAIPGSPIASAKGRELSQPLTFVRNPYRCLDRCARRSGDWFTVRVAGVGASVFTNQLAAVGEPAGERTTSNLQSFAIN